MKHIIYKTTCLVTGKIYIGKHSTNDLDDGYLGSGQLLRCAVKRYGKKQFVREILFTFRSEAKAFRKEREIVTEEFVARADNYNVCLGGGGLAKGSIHSEEVRRKLSIAMTGAGNPQYGKTRTKAQKAAVSAKLTGRPQPEYQKESRCRYYEKNPGPMSGKKHSEETRKRLCKMRAGVPRKSYELLRDDGTIHRCDNIQAFCAKLGIRVSNLMTYSKQVKFYHGYMIRKGREAHA